MNRRPTGNYRPAGNRPAPSRRTNRPAPHRRGHPTSRRERAGLCRPWDSWPWSAVDRGGIIVWRCVADGAEQAAARVLRLLRPHRPRRPRPPSSQRRRSSRQWLRAGRGSERRHACRGSRSVAFNEPGSHHPVSRIYRGFATFVYTGSCRRVPPAATLAAPSDSASMAARSAALALRLLELVNVDRAARVSPVAWDPIAAQAGQEHL